MQLLSLLLQRTDESATVDSLEITAVNRLDVLAAISVILPQMGEEPLGVVATATAERSWTTVLERQSGALLNVGVYDDRQRVCFPVAAEQTEFRRNFVRRTVVSNWRNGAREVASMAFPRHG